MPGFVIAVYNILLPSYPGGPYTVESVVRFCVSFEKRPKINA
jgi:hypothetical protein